MIENETETAVDKWIMAIPDNVYDACPCGCGKKFRFALKEGIGTHTATFITKVENGEIE
jgi:hypothetical protein